MPMTHVGYIGYVAVVLLAWGSPVLLFLLYRGWKRGHLLKTVGAMVLGIPLLAAVLYGLFWAGLMVMATLSR